jgi:hypothetical protein
MAWRLHSGLAGLHQSNLEGVSASVTVHVVEPSIMLPLTAVAPVPPYNSWATAAKKHQDAVDAATVRGALVLVTMGCMPWGRGLHPYDENSGEIGVGPSRVVVTNSIRLESVNGPLVTIIDGDLSTNEFGEATGTRGVLATNAVLSGFTVTNGLAANGAGVLCERTAVLTNCVIAGNGANLGYYAGGSSGGGVAGGTLFNCVLTRNRSESVSGHGPSASGVGGGASGSVLYHCSLTYNYANASGGGALGCELYNCTLIGNSVFYGGYGSSSGGGASGCRLYPAR